MLKNIPKLLSSLAVIVLLLAACGGGENQQSNQQGSIDAQSTPAQTAQQATANSGMIMIGQTQSFNNDFGHMEVTLDYVTFIDRFVTTVFETDFEQLPDDGHTFLYAALTIQNLGTTQGTVLTAWNTIIYDGVFEFVQSIQDGNFVLNPLTPPSTASLLFMIPDRVAESDGSLVLNFGDGTIGGSTMSFVVRGDSSNVVDEGDEGDENIAADEPPITTDGAGSQAQDAALDQQLFGGWVLQLEGAPEWVVITRTFNPDGTGYWWGDGPGQSFAWRTGGGVVTLDVTCDGFGDEWTEIYQYDISGDTLILTHTEGWQNTYLRESAATANQSFGDVTTNLIGLWIAREFEEAMIFDFLENGRVIVQFELDGVIVDSEALEWSAWSHADPNTGVIDIFELDGYPITGMLFEFVSDNHLLLDLSDGEPPLLFIRQ